MQEGPASGGHLASPTHLPRSGLLSWGCFPCWLAWALPRSHTRGGFGAQTGCPNPDPFDTPANPTTPYSSAEGPALSPPSECPPRARLSWVPIPVAGGDARAAWPLWAGISGKVAEATPKGEQGLQNESAGQEGWQPGVDRGLIINTQTLPWDPKGPSGLASALAVVLGDPLHRGPPWPGCLLKGRSPPRDLSPFIHMASALKSQGHRRRVVSFYSPHRGQSLQTTIPSVPPLFPTLCQALSVDHLLGHCPNPASDELCPHLSRDGEKPHRWLSGDR